MKEKVVGIISFLGATGWGLFALYFILDNGIRHNEISLLALIYCISVVFYVVSSKFGEKAPVEFKKIKYAMKYMNFDLFKTLIIVLLIGFLFVFYQYSQNGRYQSYVDVDYLIDTRTGETYYVGEGYPERESGAIE